MRWDVTSPPAERPVSWADAKAHLRLDTEDDRALVESLIDAAALYAEQAIQGSLVQREITATFEAGEPIALPRGPVSEFQGVTDAESRGVDAALYRVGNSDRLRLEGPATFPVTVVYLAGYANAAAVPADLKLCVLMHAATLYENRESVAEKGRTPVPHHLESFYRLRRRSAGAF